jgi:hypothetical protein
MKRQREVENIDNGRRPNTWAGGGGQLGQQPAAWRQPSTFGSFCLDGHGNEDIFSPTKSMKGYQRTGQERSSCGPSYRSPEGEGGGVDVSVSRTGLDRSPFGSLSFDTSPKDQNTAVGIGSGKPPFPARQPRGEDVGMLLDDDDDDDNDGGSEWGERGKSDMEKNGGIDSDDDDLMRSIWTSKPGRDVCDVSRMFCDPPHVAGPAFMGVSLIGARKRPVLRVDAMIDNLIRQQRLKTYQPLDDNGAFELPSAIGPHPCTDHILSKRLDPVTSLKMHSLLRISQSKDSDDDGDDDSNAEERDKMSPSSSHSRGGRLGRRHQEPEQERQQQWGPRLSGESSHTEWEILDCVVEGEHESDGEGDNEVRDEGSMAPMDLDGSIDGMGWTRSSTEQTGMHPSWVAHGTGTGAPSGAFNKQSYGNNRSGFWGGSGGRCDDMEEDDDDSDG